MKAKIREKVTLAECKAGDNIWIDYSPNKSWRRVNGIIVKIKPIQGNKYQIKYKSDWQRDAKVLKADVPANAKVERTIPGPEPVKEIAVEFPEDVDSKGGETDSGYYTPEMFFDMRRGMVDLVYREVLRKASDRVTGRMPEYVTRYLDI
jgi:hypothetical protein